jgi:predicted dehydrogenase
MRYLVLGCGSMGKRRVRDLLRLDAGEVLAFDTREDRRRELSARFDVRVPDTLEECLGTRPDALLVCLPPDQHARSIELGIAAGMHVFSEAPTALLPEDIDRIIRHAHACDRLVAPSCTYLHYPFNRRVAELAAGGGLGKLLGLVLHFGNYIGDWHPWEDYRAFYASDRARGGMCIDVIIHMLHLARSLAGEFSAVACLAAKRAGFESPGGFDTYDVLLDSRAGVSVNLHCDIVARPYSLLQRAAFEDGTVSWNWNALEILRPGRPTEPMALPGGFQFEDVYAIELRHFLDAIRGGTPYMHSLEAEKALLETIIAAERTNILNRRCGV